MIVRKIALLNVLFALTAFASHKARRKCPAIPLVGDINSKTCECDVDWNAGICGGSRKEPLETVCVCRDLHSERGQCNQFVTKCFKDSHSTISSGCSCCFRQERQHCNQLSCNAMRPDVGNSTTSCSCYDDFSLIEEQLCADSPSFDQSESLSFVLFEICGVAFTYIHLVIIICGLFLTVLLITCFFLCLTRYQIDKQRTRKFERREKARQSLLIQKQDEDKYLP